ncbi:abortive infection family protein [Paenibacillus phoenicis]|uniref:Abortive infection family protein n=1 Tax=Paenibacillus phoenicis TaxID=554117 RepID=A0ABU5PLS5_9BACL|nr:MULTISPECIES: abortive infection family protein [Paenibacillus]MEA3570893.1 abortive infection family protein [Paenibacillus phoenicis]
MSDLTNIEKIKLERIFNMGGGYVLNFSNNSFQQSVFDSVNIDVYDPKYSIFGDSKANRLRAIWRLENNYIVSVLTIDLLNYWKEMKARFEEEISDKEQELFDECIKIAEKLKRENISEHLADLTEPQIDDMNFKLLAKNIREAIEKNEPEVALDRLHTYMVKYIRSLCDRHGISYDKSKPLHSFYGEYIKFLKKNGYIESSMTERILKSSISILEAFNEVRNDRSFAHDNSILNYQESLLIFKNISSIVSFIESIESSKVKNKVISEEEWNEILS